MGKGIHKLLLIGLVPLGMYCGDNYITVKEYEALNKTAPSLQKLIIDYHHSIIENPRAFILDFESKSDGSENSTSYKNFFQTKDGYEGAELQLLTLKAGTKNFAIIGRQFANMSNTVNAMIHDYVFMRRDVLYGGNLDILWGINWHMEPEYETIGETAYFTDKDPKDSIKLMGNFKFHNMDINLEVNKDNQIEKALFSYTIDTNIGDINPQVIKGIQPFEYYDAYITYDTKKLFENKKFQLKALVKNRKITNNDGVYQEGIIAKLIEIEKSFSMLKLYVGYSRSREFSQDELGGTMFKIGLGLPKNKDNREAELYFGTSKNYYLDLLDLRMIDQELSLFGVKIYW